MIKRSLIILLILCCYGCGTIITLTDNSQWPNQIYAGTRASLFGHSTQLDVPFSLALDTVVLPYTIPRTIYNMNHKEEPVNRGYTEGTVSVFLIPLDDFPVDYVAQLARELSRVLKIHVKPTVVMGTRGLQPFPSTNQYCAEDIVESATPVVERLPEKRKESAFILITSRDINEKARNFRFLFAWHQKEKRISVISTARMLAGEDNSRADDKLIFERILKMTKRAIGEQYYGLQRSADISDVMYSPIMSLEDIDKMGMDFTGLKK